LNQATDILRIGAFLERVVVLRMYWLGGLVSITLTVGMVLPVDIAADVYLFILGASYVSLLTFGIEHVLNLKLAIGQVTRRRLEFYGSVVALQIIVICLLAVGALLYMPEKATFIIQIIFYGLSANMMAFFVSVERHRSIATLKSLFLIDGSLQYLSAVLIITGALPLHPITLIVMTRAVVPLGALALNISGKKDWLFLPRFPNFRKPMRQLLVFSLLLFLSSLPITHLTTVARTIIKITLSDAEFVSFVLYTTFASISYKLVGNLVWVKTREIMGAPLGRSLLGNALNFCFTTSGIGSIGMGIFIATLSLLRTDLSHSALVLSVVFVMLFHRITVMSFRTIALRIVGIRQLAIRQISSTAVLAALAVGAGFLVHKDMWILFIMFFVGVDILIVYLLPVLQWLRRNQNGR